MHHMRVLPLRPRTSPRRSRKQRNGPPQSRSRITPGLRYFLMVTAFAALSLDRSDHRQRAIIKRPPTEAAYGGRKAMEWVSRKTSIAGIQIPNWGIVLGAV